MRHAHARQVNIDISFTQERMIVSVTDDGVGLPENWSRPGHFGLRGLAERVEHLGGSLQVSNREPRGACLRAEIPLAVAS
jgi:two-component system sensor histidine kinase UhpB